MNSMTILSKGFALAILLILVCCSVLQGQTVSPLFQVMSSNSLINRPMIFREMQDEIQKQVDKTTPGLLINDFYQDMALWRRKFIDLIKTPRLQIAENGITIEIEGKVFDTIPLKDKNALEKNGNDLFKEVDAALTKKINGIIDGLEFEPSSTKNPIPAALILALEETGLTRNISTSGFEDSTQLKFSRIISGMLFREVKRVILSDHPEFENQLARLTGQKLVEYVNNIINKVVLELKENLSQALDRGEHEVAKAVNEISRWLISGNTGLAVSKGQGAFSGGVQLSYIHPGCQIGVYFNGAFNKGDTTKPTQTLVGVRTQIAWDAIAIDVLGSGLFGDIKYSVFDSGELGSGFSYRTGSDLIFGFSYYIFFGSKFFPEHTYGLTMKGTSADSPGILFGARVQTNEGVKNDVSPIFQISYPVFGK